jgi:hypothetical protein
LLLGAAPALAITISNPSFVDASTSAFDDTGPTGSVAESAAAFSASGPGGFTLRYEAVVGADLGGAGGSPFIQSFTSSLSLSFEVTELAGVSWLVNVDVLRAGALSIVSDGSGSALVTLDAFTVAHAGAGSLLGSLDLAALSLGNGAAPDESPDLAFSQSVMAAVAGVGTGSAQLVTLVFGFGASAATLDAPAGLVHGDEAALRLGRDSALSGFTADDYPGAGGRSLTADGLFVGVSLPAVAVPEPRADALLALGLIALGWFDRSQRRRPEANGGRVRAGRSDASPAPRRPHTRR